MSFDFKNDPIDNFLKLYKEAQVRGVPEAHAMALSTVNKNLQTSVRTVFYKGLHNRGFVFYTNYNGRKAQDIAFNNKVCVNFFWPHLDMQIRIEGVANKIDRESSEKYFSTRPRLSQIGAWASSQSEELSSFDEFYQIFNKYQTQFEGQKVLCPPHWGGYVIEPTEIEFWFGKTGRLHERYVYQKIDSNQWKRLLRFP